MCAGSLQTLYNPAPPVAQAGYHPPLLVDQNGRLYVRLADKLSSLNDSVTIERGASCGVGAHGNAWLAAGAVVGGLSVSVDTQSCSQVTIFGNTNLAGSFDILVSQDGANFYMLENFAIATPGNFAVSRTIGARFVRLRSQTAFTITATIAAKA